VLTRPWALPKFGLGLVVLQCHSLLPRTVLCLVPARACSHCYMHRLHVFINKQNNSVLNLKLKQVGLMLVMFTSTKNY
jgi:hypothetical protein